MSLCNFESGFNILGNKRKSKTESLVENFETLFTNIDNTRENYNIKQVFYTLGTTFGSIIT